MRKLIKRRAVEMNFSFITKKLLKIPQIVQILGFWIFRKKTVK